MTPDTVINECQDNDIDNIPQVKYDFISIENLSMVESNALVGK